MTDPEGEALSSPGPTSFVARGKYVVYHDADGQNEPSKSRLLLAPFLFGSEYDVGIET